MEKRVLNKLHKTQMKILDEIVDICKKNNLDYFLIGGTLLGAVRHKGYIPWDDDLDIAMPREDYKKFLKIAQKELGNEYILDYHKTNPKYWLSFAKVRLKNTEYIEETLEKYSTEKGIWVDIFPLDNTKKDNSIILNIQWFVIKKFKLLMWNKIRSRSRTNNYKGKLKKLISLITSTKITIRIFNIVMQLQNKSSNKYFVNFGSQYGIKKQTHLKEKYLPAKKIEFEGKKYKVPRDYNYVLTKIYGANYMELPPLEKRITHNPLKIKFEDGQEIFFDKEK